MQNIYNITLENLKQFLITNNIKPYVSNQIYDWLYKKRIKSFDEMTNIKLDTIEILKTNFYFGKLNLIKKEEDEDLYKYLFKLDDNNYIESVLMIHNYGNSLCISTQVGCNFNCLFCESGKLKKIRDLKASEMVMQILDIEQDLNIRISHVVIMGIGEPFDNYENTIDFIKIINENKGIAIGARHITISTSGVVPKIKEFMNLDIQVNLAISLHAPNDEIRNKLMPINKVYNIKSLIDVVKEYIDKTNRRVTFEYIMLDKINDDSKSAQELSKLLKGINCYVNLISYNKTSVDLKPSSKETILKFYDILKKNKINVTIRKEFGSNVSAACGQLKANYKEE